MADNLKISQWIHNELFLSNARDGFFTKTGYACHLLLAFHVNDSRQITTVRISADPYQLRNVNGLAVVDALFI